MTDINTLVDPSEWLEMDCTNCTRVTMVASPTGHSNLNITVDEVSSSLSCPACNFPFFNDQG